MMPKSGYRFSENIMLQQEAKAGWRLEEKSSRFSSGASGQFGPGQSQLIASAREQPSGTGTATARPSRGADRDLRGRASHGFFVGRRTRRDLPQGAGICSGQAG